MEDVPPFIRLSSIDVTFVVVDPFAICPDYNPKVVVETAECFLLAIVEVREQLFANLAAPLLIDWKIRVGRQILLPNQPCAFLVKSLH